MATIRKRRRADGRTTWAVRIQRKGYPIKYASFDTRKAAEDWATEVERAMKRRTYIDTAEAETTTLYKALERYEREWVPRKKGSRQLGNRCKRWRKRAIAAKMLAEVRGTHLAEIRDEMAEAGKAASTIRNELNVISHLYNFARKEWGMEGLKNPVSDIYVPQPPAEGRDRRLVGDEEKRLLEATAYPLREYIILAIETAMRAGELRSLQADRVNLKTCVAHLPETKNSSERDVPLSPRAKQTIKKAPARVDGYVLTPWSASYLSHQFGDLCVSLGIEDLHFHDLRHEATSRLVESGRFSMAECMRITGHKTARLFMRYYHPRAEDLAKRMRS